MDTGEVDRLVRLSQGGDEGAFERLLLGHQRAITSTLIACGVRCPETARDLAQDVALKAWTSLDSLQRSGAFSAWIRRIAANAARDNLRRRAVRREESLERALSLASDDDPGEQVERLAELREMLAVLETEDEEVVTLLIARAEGESVAALADRLELSQGALKMRLMRVRKRIRQRLLAGQ